jgi:hypothetical protein
MMRSSSWLWAVILILLGVLLLLNNLGILNVDVWGLIGPLFLIGVGLSILWSVLFGWPSVEAEEVTIPLQGVTEARIHIEHGAGRLRVGAGADPGHLVTGTFTGGLEHRARHEGQRLSVEMCVSPGAFPAIFFPWRWGPGRTLDWTFGLSREIPLALYFETGAGEARLDLTDLQVTDLRLQTGASSTNLTLPSQAGHSRAKIEAGAAAVTVRVPSGVAARIQTEAGLASITVNRDRFPREGGVYRSPDYDTASNKVDLHIEAGVGSVDVR